MKKYLRVDIVDNDLGCGEDRVMDSHILVIPANDNSYKEKLSILQEKLSSRFDEENEFSDNFQAIDVYIKENFEVLDISDVLEIEW